MCFLTPHSGRVILKGIGKWVMGKYLHTSSFFLCLWERISRYFFALSLLSSCSTHSIPEDSTGDLNEYDGYLTDSSDPALEEPAQDAEADTDLECQPPEPITARFVVDGEATPAVDSSIALDCTIDSLERWPLDTRISLLCSVDGEMDEAHAVEIESEPELYLTSRLDEGAAVTFRYEARALWGTRWFAILGGATLFVGGVDADSPEPFQDEREPFFGPLWFEDPVDMGCDPVTDDCYDAVRRVLPVHWRGWTRLVSDHSVESLADLDASAVITDEIVESRAELRCENVSAQWIRALFSFSFGP